MSATNIKKWFSQEANIRNLLIFLILFAFAFYLGLHPQPFATYSYKTQTGGSVEVSGISSKDATFLGLIGTLFAGLIVLVITLAGLYVYYLLKRKK